MSKFVLNDMGVVWGFETGWVTLGSPVNCTAKSRTNLGRMRSSQMQGIRVHLVEDNRLHREGITAKLNELPDIKEEVPIPKLS